MTFILPFTLCIYINPKFRPLGHNLHHYHLGSERGVWVGKHKHISFEKRGSNITLGNFSSQIKFLSEKHFHVSITSLPIHLNSKHISSNLKLFFIELSMRPTNPPWLAFHSSSKTHTNDCILVEKHVSWWFNMKNSTCAFMHQIWDFLYQNFSSTHEIHHLAHMKSMLVLASNHPIFWWNLMIMSKTSQNSHLSFHIVSNTFKFQTIFQWLFTYHIH